LRGGEWKLYPIELHVKQANRSVSDKGQYRVEPVPSRAWEVVVQSKAIIVAMEWTNFEADDQLRWR
jgi:hypothetical protein